MTVNVTNSVNLQDHNIVDSSAYKFVQVNSIANYEEKAAVKLEN